MALPLPSLTAAIQGPFAPYVDAEVVSLGGGAGVDWTPTKAPFTRGFYVGTAGNIKVDTAGGSVGVVIPVPVGEIRLVASKVYSTADGTSAANVVAMY